jgi:hypothetical protein
MSTDTLNENAVTRLAAQADAVGRLAQNSGGFAAVVAAFESKDPNAFRWVLDRLEILPQCELICEWVRIKLCVLRCIEVCGPPRDNLPTPTLQEFAHAVVQLASDERLLRRVVDAVSCGDANEYRAVLAGLDLNDFCHLLCSWVCSIIYQRVCEVVCTPQPVPIPDAVNEVRTAAKVMASVIADKEALEVISRAAVALNCETLQSTIEQAGFASGCEIICRLICSWRCVWVCRELCQLATPVLTGANGIDEARNFALAARQLASQRRALGDLVSAVQRRDAAAYGQIIARFGLGPYCLQVCSWVCSVTCHEFCICVCPNPALEPWFTTVGYFDIYSDIDAASGKTNKTLPFVTLACGGGPNFAFFDCLQLGGFCPSFSPTSPGTPMQYRFLYATVSTTLAAPISAAQTSITVTSSAGAPPVPFNVSVCNPGETGETITVNNISGTTWTVVRGQAGTTPAAAAAGATLWINPAPITGNLVCQVEAGTRLINWPQNLSGIAGATLVPTFQSVIIANAPTPPDPTPPVAGATWVGPTAHYITPDPTTGWIPVDPNAIGGGFQTLLGFDTTQPQVAPGAPPLTVPPIGTPGGAPAGSPVPPARQGVGTNLSIIFEATRVTVTTVDYSNSLCKIHVNNWSEVNNLWFLEFTTGGAGCCTPIDATLSVQLTVDHEEMDSGAWSLSITSCSPSAPGGIISTANTALATAITASQTSIPVFGGCAVFPATPFDVSLGGTGEIMTVTGVSGTTWTVLRGQSGTTAAAAAAGATLSYPVSFPAGVTASPRGGFGTIVENTSTWSDCSYTVTLTTRPGLTNGLVDRTAIPNSLTFCICGH